MNLVERLFAIPYAHLWVPGAIFVVVAGGMYWLLRRSAHGTETRPDSADTETDGKGTVQLATATMTQTSEAEKEERSAARRAGNLIAVRIADPAQKQSLGNGHVIDRSLGGLRIATDQKFDAGELLSIRPASASDMVPWVEVSVRSCQPNTEMPSTFELGCQFVTPPPYPILMLFG